MYCTCILLLALQDLCPMINVRACMKYIDYNNKSMTKNSTHWQKNLDKRLHAPVLPVHVYKRVCTVQVHDYAEH